MSKKNRVIFYADPNMFLHRFVAIDETWIHHFQPEMEIVEAHMVLHLPRKPRQGCPQVM